MRELLVLLTQTACLVVSVRSVATLDVPGTHGLQILSGESLSTHSFTAQLLTAHDVGTARVETIADSQVLQFTHLWSASASTFWLILHDKGVHATLAVAVATTVASGAVSQASHTTHVLLARLKPWKTFPILPHVVSWHTPAVVELASSPATLVLPAAHALQEPVVGVVDSVGTPSL